jgi:3-(3-hydroxy-phenyl)propionate hydroxylase
MAIAGDAAHVNNPLGGMGLNGGVHDGINLAEKLAKLWHGEAGLEILDLYTRQRRAPQIEYVQRITIENKKLVSERDPAQRRARQDALRKIGADKKLAYEYLLNSSMIAMVRKAAAIT